MCIELYGTIQCNNHEFSSIKTISCICHLQFKEKESKVVSVFLRISFFLYFPVLYIYIYIYMSDMEERNIDALIHS